MPSSLKKLCLWLSEHGNQILIGLIVTIGGGIVVALFGNCLGQLPAVREGWLPSPTSTPSPTVSPTPSATIWDNCTRDLFNCSDFSSCDEVMEYFLRCPSDPSLLDADNDGIPCESLCQ